MAAINGCLDPVQRTILDENPQIDDLAFGAIPPEGHVAISDRMELPPLPCDNINAT